MHADHDVKKPAISCFWYFLIAWSFHAVEIYTPFLKALKISRLKWICWPLSGRSDEPSTYHSTRKRFGTVILFLQQRAGMVVGILELFSTKLWAISSRALALIGPTFSDWCNCLYEDILLLQSKMRFKWVLLGLSSHLIKTLTYACAHKSTDRHIYTECKR